MVISQPAATPRLQIRLLGQIEFWDGAVRLTPALRRKTAAILAYLAATGQIHSRRALIDWFCQSADDPQASLRWHLSRIRRNLGPEIILADAETVRFVGALVHLDCAEFGQVLGGALHDQPNEAVIAAVERYRGEFLAGLALADAPEFELWLLAERARLRQLYERGLSELVARDIAGERFDAAIGWALHLTQSNPLLEEAHARLIWLYAAPASGRPPCASSSSAVSCCAESWRSTRCRN
jgi:DNA-binding SARP family transcriptional activator